MILYNINQYIICIYITLHLSHHRISKLDQVLFIDYSHFNSHFLFCRSKILSGFLKNPLLLNKNWEFLVGFQKWDLQKIIALVNERYFDLVYLLLILKVRCYYDMKQYFQSNDKKPFHKIELGIFCRQLIIKIKSSTSLVTLTIIKLDICISFL